MHLRVRIAKKQVQQGMRMDGTIVQDGFNKCQLLFPNNIKLIPGEEITILSASVAWNGNILIPSKFNLYKIRWRSNIDGLFGRFFHPICGCRENDWRQRLGGIVLPAARIKQYSMI